MILFCLFPFRRRKKADQRNQQRERKSERSSASDGRNWMLKTSMRTSWGENTQHTWQTCQHDIQWNIHTIRVTWMYRYLTHILVYRVCVCVFLIQRDGGWTVEVAATAGRRTIWPAVQTHTPEIWGNCVTRTQRYR